MESTIIFDAAQKAQVIQPSEDPLTTLALAVLFVGLLGVITYLYKFTHSRAASESHVSYKRADEHPAITRLRSLRYR
ncbi:hypothetical protein HY490_05135 [Candidatus Woesearchaeota archaeon]|nr:hypothetical protein [Candidatus Woesearchaeota archaeon]